MTRNHDDELAFKYICIYTMLKVKFGLRTKRTVKTDKRQVVAVGCS